MGKILYNSKQIDHRYFFYLTVKNIVDRTEMYFWIRREEMDKDEIVRVLEAYGFNTNHPRSELLMAQILNSLTLFEIQQFLDCLSSLDVLVVQINPFIIKTLTGQFFGEGEDFAWEYSTKSLEFSQLIDKPLPIEVIGPYDPDHKPRFVLHRRPGLQLAL